MRKKTKLAAWAVVFKDPNVLFPIPKIPAFDMRHERIFHPSAVFFSQSAAEYAFTHSKDKEKIEVVPIQIIYKALKNDTSKNTSKI